MVMATHKELHAKLHLLDILDILSKNFSALAMASVLSVATSSIKPIFKASSVVNSRPVESASSVCRLEITFLIEY